MTYLYRDPLPAPDTVISQTPDSEACIGWRSGSQPFQSPTTETLSAFGAHTRKTV